MSSEDTRTEADALRAEYAEAKIELRRKYGVDVHVVAGRVGDIGELGERKWQVWCKFPGIADGVCTFKHMNYHPALREAIAECKRIGRMQPSYTLAEKSEGKRLDKLIEPLQRQSRALQDQREARRSAAHEFWAAQQASPKGGDPAQQ